MQPLEEQIYGNRMTIETMRWIYGSHRQGELMRVKSPEEIKQIIWKYIAPTFGKSYLSGQGVVTTPTYEDDKTRFITGAKLIDVNAIYTYICNKRGYCDVRN